MKSISRKDVALAFIAGLVVVVGIVVMSVIPSRAENVYAQSSARFVGNTFPEMVSGYMKIGDIKGESTDSDHKDWINLLSVSQSITRSETSTRRGDIDFEDIEVAKTIDKASPKIQEAIATGRVFPEVEIHVAKNAAGKPVPYYMIKLKNVIVTSFSNHAESGEVPTESMSLNYEEIKVVYAEYGKDGKKGGNVEFEWKVEEGE